MLLHLTLFLLKAPFLSPTLLFLQYPASPLPFIFFSAYNLCRKWGTVEDVRIPLKEKRNFGFVTFTSPVPVKAILSSEVEHKVKDIVVLVKPYCEKGKPTK